MVETTDEFGRPLFELNNKMWVDPITETPYNGTIEIWELYNLTPDTHPIHLHLVQFQILNRAPITVDENGNIINVGKAKKPDSNEMGWKDTVRANPGEVTRIIARFGPFTGTYVWHCHIIEHEDHDMMRPYEVLQNHDFDPCIPIPGVCSDDSFTQCCDQDPKHCSCKRIMMMMSQVPITIPLKRTMVMGDSSFNTNILTILLSELNLLVLIA